ncbi:hypothetical protein O3P69_001195 [Scylla paramamosain]|uniref:C2H2-type domain-containing protein n=1 Tax=Scylla paramamosain TaxID=85552 RepID=A0AAW0UQI3_SCYPA
MEGRTSTQATSGDQAFNANMRPEPDTKSKSALILEDIAEMDKAVFACGEDNNHSTALASDAPSPVQLMQDSGVSCHLCKKMYKNKGSLATHLRVKHKMSGNTRAKMPCLEVGCDYRGNRIARLITHLIQEHKMKFHCEKVTFQKKEDFWKWRKEAEERCRSSYCAETSAKTMVSGDVKFFLRCRRSGYVKCHSRGTLARGVRKGSVKINAVCTSFMEVTFGMEGGATVHFCRTHYGHADDGQHLRMNAEERETIRQLILEGQTASSIITTMKTKMPQHRHHLLKYANIRNISIRQNFQTHGKGLAEGDQDQEAFPDVVMSEADQNSPTLQVEKEVEVEAIDRESPDTPEILDHIQACSLERLQAEVKTKVEKVLHLSSTVTSEDTLKYVSENLDFLIDMLESCKDIEVIPDSSEPSEDTGQNVVLHKDIDGNTHLLLCSSKSIDDLMCKKKDAV